MSEEVKKEEVKETAQEQTGVTMGDLLKVAFKDGFTSAFAFINDQQRLLNEQKALDKIAGNYIDLFFKKVQEEQEKVANEKHEDNNVNK